MLTSICINTALAVVAGQLIGARRQSSTPVILPPRGFNSHILVFCSRPQLADRVVLQYKCRGGKKNASVPWFLNIANSLLVSSTWGWGVTESRNKHHLNH